MAKEEPARPKRPLKPPPNFQSRNMQLRLFVLVVACMGVIYMVTEAANPDRWRWFFGLPPVAEKPADAPPEEIDTRISDPQQVVVSDPDVVRITDPFRGSLDDATKLAANDPVASAQADGWSAFFEQASRDEHDLVAQGLKAAEKPEPLPTADATAWNELLEKIDGFWEGYRQNALRALDAPAEEDAPPPISDDEKKTWVAVLDNVRDAWRADRAILAKLSQAGEIAYSDAERERLRLWQLRWERLGLAAIRDDTVHRPPEGDAWFHLFDVLNHTKQKELDEQAVERTSYVQLYRETNEHRGKLVRFNGRVMQAKRIKATRNVYGIEHQYILWIKPEDAPKSPIVVYALEMPKGFPSLDAPGLDGGWTKLREDVTITGYLFKRWAYRAQEGTHVAPLVLAKAPQWIPSPDVTRGEELPSLPTFVMWLTGCALFGVIVAVVIYLRTKAVSPAIESFQNSPAAQQELRESLSGANAGPGPLEALRLLEERDQQNEGRST